MKKMISLMAVVAALIMMLSSCTPSGMPTSLVGVWKTETERYVRVNGSYTDETATAESYIEFTDDDYMVYGSTKDELTECKKDKKDCTKIIKATCNELYVRSGAQVSEDSLIIIKYELAGNKLTLTQNSSSVKIYTKD